MKHTFSFFILMLSCLQLHASDYGQGTHLEQETHSLTPTTSRSSSPSPIRNHEAYYETQDYGNPISPEDIDEAYIQHLENLLFNTPACPRASSQPSSPTQIYLNVAEENCMLEGFTRTRHPRPAWQTPTSSPEQKPIAACAAYIVYPPKKTMPDEATILKTLLKYPIFHGCRQQTEIFAQNIADRHMTLEEVKDTMHELLTDLATSRGNDYLDIRFKQAAQELAFIQEQSDPCAT